MAGEQRTFNESFCRRVKQLRMARGWTQEEMAEALKIPLDRYKKYEIRSPLPPYLIEPFARFVGRDAVYVLTGKSPGQRRGPRAPANPPEPRRAKGGQR